MSSLTNQFGEDEPVEFGPEGMQLFLRNDESVSHRGYPDLSMMGAMVASLIEQESAQVAQSAAQLEALQEAQHAAQVAPAAQESA